MIDGEIIEMSPIGSRHVRCVIFVGVLAKLDVFPIVS
ncbi:MAG: hypothetical protein IPM21_02245 [Acidobacteria bacterium]|nr:hypothetical protein [Acidobacteriota bacterium]